MVLLQNSRMNLSSSLVCNSEFPYFPFQMCNFFLFLAQKSFLKKSRMNIEEIMKNNSVYTLSSPLDNLRLIRMHGQEEIYHQNRIM